ncbi:DUF308 domain-containing protein [Microbacteriaceae bacterium 4G12]
MTNPTTGVVPVGPLPEDQPNANSSDTSGHAPSTNAEPGHAVAPTGKNPYALTSLVGVVLGILAIVLAPSFPLILVLEFGIAVVFGVLGIRRASRSGVGRAPSIWGLVLGILGLIVALVMIGASSPAVRAGVDSVRSLAGIPAAPSPPAPPLSTADLVPMADGLITGDGYSYSVPAGWGVPENAPADVDTFAMDLTAPADWADNVNVVISPSGVVTADDVESAGVDGLEDGGATDVMAHDRVTVAGSESAHITASFDFDGLEYDIHQYYLTRDDQTYIVTFSYSKSVAEADATRVAASVLTSWVWDEG